LTNIIVKLTLDLMEESKEEPIASKKNSHTASKLRINSKSNKLVITGIIFVILFILIIFVQSPQTLKQLAATTNQTPGSQCSPVPFYCIVMGPNGGKECVRPSPCPSPTQTPNFVAQQAPPPASIAATMTPTVTIATKSATLCATPSGALTTKLTIHFPTDEGDVNGYTITAADKPALNTYAAALKKEPQAIVTINGYTDSITFAPGTPGPINTNQALSLARAQAAEAYLKSQGATANTYVTKGNGATDFVAPNNPTTGNVLNRRDEITSNITAKSCTTVAVKPVQPVCTSDVNWSGYLNKLPANTDEADLRSTWNVSTVTCTGTEIGISQWPGIDAGNTVIAQVGSMSGCVAGKSKYYPWVVHLPSLQAIALPTNQYPIKAGDTFTGIIDMTALGKFTTTLTNVTGKWSYTYPMTFSAAADKLPLQQEIILEDEGYGVTPFVPGLTQFTTPTYSNNMFSTNNGALANFDQAPNLSCDNLNATSTVDQDTTSNISTQNFTIKWLHM
jgi:outer membrane protein OmpA-like peptidoglycan-associated protein